MLPDTFPATSSHPGEGRGPIAEVTGARDTPSRSPRNWAPAFAGVGQGQKGRPYPVPPRRRGPRVPDATLVAPWAPAFAGEQQSWDRPTGKRRPSTPAKAGAQLPRSRERAIRCHDRHAIGPRPSPGWDRGRKVASIPFPREGGGPGFQMRRSWPLGPRLRGGTAVTGQPDRKKAPLHPGEGRGPIAEVTEARDTLSRSPRPWAPAFAGVG